MEYRVYLLNSESRIRAGESFSAVNVDEAGGMAADLFTASSDVFDGYELWEGPNRIVHASGDSMTRPIPRLEELADARQERLLELELTLQASFTCVHESKELMAAVTRMIESKGFNGSATPRGIAQQTWLKLN